MRSLFATICFLFLAGEIHSWEKPNIILIFSDDHGYSDLGSQGIQSDLKTPNLDQLVAGGVRFTSGYVTAPQCVLSRAGLLAGKYQNRFGVEANKYPLQGFDSELTIAERLKKVGYVTGMTGKWHLGAPQQIVDHGFDYVYYKNSNRPGWSNYDLEGNDKKPGQENSKLYHLDANSSAACAFIKKNYHRPFFFYCAYRAPHVPLDAPDKYLSRFSEDMPKRRRQALAMISAMDDGVGKIMRTLREHKIEEKTLIFFIGDNGAPLKIHKVDAPGGGPGWDGSLNDPLNGEKGMLTEGGIRVPFVAYWKNKIRAGQVFDQPVISLDVAATAVELAGLRQDPKLDGINLVPFLDGTNHLVPNRKLYWRWLSQSAIREGKWKYLNGGGREYLFDLSQDKEEKKNLIQQFPEVAKNLAAELNGWTKQLKPLREENKNLAATQNRYFEHYLEGNLQPRIPSSPSNTKAVQGWIVRNGKIKVEDGYLRVSADKSSKNTPFLVMSRLALPPGSKVKLRLNSDVTGKVKVAWRLEGQTDFKPEQVNSASLRPKDKLKSATIEINSDKKIIHIRVLLPEKNVSIQSIELSDSNNKLLRKWDFRNDPNKR